MKLTKQELVELLEEMVQLIKDDDSFEGNFSYTCMIPGLEDGKFEVSGAFRHGNSNGQGGMAILPAGIPEELFTGDRQ